MGDVIQKHLGGLPVSYLCTQEGDIGKAFYKMVQILKNVILKWIHKMESTYFVKFCARDSTGLVWHLFSGISHIVTVGL